MLNLLVESTVHNQETTKECYFSGLDKNYRCHWKQELALKLPQSKVSFFNIYRPPPSSSFFSKPFSCFLDEFTFFLSTAATTPHEFLLIGDFNLHLDNPSDHFTSQFLSVLSSFNLTQHVDFPTHNKSCLLYTSPSPRDRQKSRMPSSA